jgi:predicted Zn-dependent protease
MRIGSLGLPELLLLLFIIVLLFRGRQLPALGRRLGEQASKPFRRARWAWSSVAGDEKEALRAEQAFGRKCAEELQGQFPGAVAPAVQQRLEGIGARLATALGDSPRRFAFRAVAAPAPNAFALPGGFVFVSDSLLRLCGDDDEAAAFVVAHEMGHVLKSHARDRLMADLVFDLVERRLPAAGRAVHQMLGKGYSREQEREADAEALWLMDAAGLDPAGGVRVLQRLAELGTQPSGVEEYFSTHPTLEERIRALREQLEASGGSR